MSADLIGALMKHIAAEEPYAPLEQIASQAQALARTGAYELMPDGNIRPMLNNPAACAGAASINRAVSKRIAAAAFPPGVSGGHTNAVAARLVAQGIDPYTMEAYKPPRDPGERLTLEQIAESLF